MMADSDHFLKLDIRKIPNGGDFIDSAGGYSRLQAPSNYLHVDLLGISADGKYLYAYALTFGDANLISVINLKTGAIRKEIPLIADTPFGDPGISRNSLTFNVPITNEQGV
jgi:hypothetical protein